MRRCRGAVTPQSVTGAARAASNLPRDRTHGCDNHLHHWIEPGVSARVWAALAEREYSRAPEPRPRRAAGPEKGDCSLERERSILAPPPREPPDARDRASRSHA